MEGIADLLEGHRFRLSSPDDLDEQFRTWIDEAHDAATSRR
jgi:hypothetical protein